MMTHSLSHCLQMAGWSKDGKINSGPQRNQVRFVKEAEQAFEQRLWSLSGIEKKKKEMARSGSSHRLAKEMKGWYIYISQPQRQPVVLQPLCNRPSSTNGLVFPTGPQANNYSGSFILYLHILRHTPIKVVSFAFQPQIMCNSLVYHPNNSPARSSQERSRIQ